MNLQYKVGIKRQVVQSLRKVFLSPNFPDKELANKINLELTYPNVQERFPAIYVSYVDRSVGDSGLGNYSYVNNVDGSAGVARQWIFEGIIILTVLALDPIERDIISATISNILSFGKDDPVYKPFREYIRNEEFVSLQPNLAVLEGGEESEDSSPWENENEFVYRAVYRINTLGSFFTEPANVGGGLIKIEDIRTYPYRSDQDIPAGDLDQPINKDWST